LATDSSGLPLSFCLSGGQAHESQYAETLLNRVGIIRKSGHLKSRPNAVLADKGYSSQKIRNHLKIKGIKAVIPFKSNEKASRDGRRKLDTQWYKKRNVVERCFGMLQNIAALPHAQRKQSKITFACLIWLY
jgi:transposase